MRNVKYSDRIIAALTLILNPVMNKLKAISVQIKVMAVTTMNMDLKAQ